MGFKKYFSELTLQRITERGAYYVYGLIDPRNNKLFYIGKGTGNRVFQHEIESDKNPESEKAKLTTIRSIENAHLEVEHILINWGLTESEAFAAEASLINLIDYISKNTLTNLVSGHHSEGCLRTEDIEQIYGAEQLSLEDFKHKILVIKINKLYDRHMTLSELYDIVRGIWRADLNRVRQVQYVLGVYNNLIVCCFKPDRWKKVNEYIPAQLPRHVQNIDLTDMKNRVLFECDDIDSFDENQQYYLYKSVEKLSYIQKAQNPITYIGI